MLHHRFLGMAGIPQHPPTRQSEDEDALSLSVNSGSDLAIQIRAFYEARAPVELTREVRPVEPEKIAERYASNPQALFAKLESKYPAPIDTHDTSVLDSKVDKIVEPAETNSQIMQETDGKIVTFTGQARTMTTVNDVSDVLDAIRACPDMSTIIMGGNTIGLGAMNAIVADIIKHNERSDSLKCLNFDDCFTRRKEIELHPSLESLGKAMASTANLIEVGLCDNALNPEGARILAPVLAKNCTNLRILRLDNTGVGPMGGKFLGLGLHAGAKRGLRLQKFSLGRSRLELKGAAAVAEALAAMGSLEEIRMPQNGIRATGITALAAAISVNPNLKVLDLNDNSIGKTGSIAIAKSIKEISKLVEINLGDCLLSAEGFDFVGEALAESHNDLKVIDLTYNEIKEKNMHILLKLLNGRKQLSKLELNGNILSEASIEQIRECINSNGGDRDDLVLGDIDEMEDPEDEDSEDESVEDSDSDEDTEEGTESSEEDDTAAIAVADLLKALSM